MRDKETRRQRDKKTTPIQPKPTFHRNIVHQTLLHVSRDHGIVEVIPTLFLARSSANEEAACRAEELRDDGNSQKVFGRCNERQWQPAVKEDVAQEQKVTVAFVRGNDDDAFPRSSRRKNLSIRLHPALVDAHSFKDVSKGSIHLGGQRFE